jgi:hypothetical protein
VEAIPVKATYLKPLVLALSAFAVAATFRCDPVANGLADVFVAHPEMRKPWPEIVRLRMFAKELLAREVAEGRRTLLETAALFRELGELPPKSVDLARPDGIDMSLPIAGRTAAERLCQHVLAHVRIALEGQPEALAKAEARLVAEFQQEFRNRGEIRLPDPSTLPSVQNLLAQTRAGLAPKQRRDLLATKANPAGQ